MPLDQTFTATGATTGKISANKPYVVTAQRTDGTGTFSVQTRLYPDPDDANYVVVMETSADDEADYVRIQSERFTTRMLADVAVTITGTATVRVYVAT